MSHTTCVSEGVSGGREATGIDLGMLLLLAILFTLLLLFVKEELEATNELIPSLLLGLRTSD